jgi:sedoheptulokinase
LAGLEADVARQVGLTAGISVFNAWGDTQASYVGSLLDSFSEASSEDAERSFQQAILFNLGTGGQICWMVPGFEPPSRAVETRPLPGGRFLRVGASLCGGAAYAWLNQTVRAWLADFGLEMSEGQIYERLDELVANCEDPAGLQVRTTFLGMRGNPDVQAGAIEGITLQNLRLGALGRATLKGTVNELYDLYRVHGGEAAGHTYVVASGGGVRKNRFLPPLIEERFGLPVKVPHRQETAAVGAALLPSLLR